MSTTYGNRPIRVRFSSNDSDGMQSFLMAQKQEPLEYNYQILYNREMHTQLLLVNNIQRNYK